VFAPALLKPAARKAFRAIGLDRRLLNDGMQAVIAGSKQLPAGYRRAGNQAVRIDMAEKLFRAAHDKRGSGGSGGRKPFAIVVLGGGVEAMAPEYGTSTLQPISIERLRYGIWLARLTGAPLAFSGGVGHAQTHKSGSEAEAAARIAREEFGRPLRWIEAESRDTRENAARTVALLKPAGIDHIVLVTHELHMPRALRAFREAAGSAMRIEGAPMSLSSDNELSLLAWVPSNTGFTQMRYALREMLGLWFGA
jgi:uncharacterized SAM-binding protein YcdF (DUF218 family)